MPKYLVMANYTSEGMKGVLSKGGTARRSAVEKMATDLGGRLESFHFAFGDHDAFVIVDLPDNAAAAAVGMAVSASGMATATTTVLLTPEEVDAASSGSVQYVAPGT
jgi:uncharacterized protein with GYD domain